MIVYMGDECNVNVMGLRVSTFATGPKLVMQHRRTSELEDQTITG